MRGELEAKRLAEHKVVCPDCSNTLTPRKSDLVCSNCRRIFQRDSEGVWRFNKQEFDQSRLSIFKDEEYVRWREIFENEEVRDWSIYSNRLKRFFSQSGHRLLARMMLRDPEIRGQSLLEIGAGTGVLLNYFPADHYVALDWSHASLALLKRNNPDAIALQTNTSVLPFGDSSFNAVASLHTLEHIYELGEHLQEVKRVLQRHRFYYFAIPTEGGVAFWLGRQIFTRRHLRKRYNLDANFIMQREHINDAKRVLKFLKMYFVFCRKLFWPLPIPLIGLNAVIVGRCASGDGPD